MRAVMPRKTSYFKNEAKWNSLKLFLLKKLRIFAIENHICDLTVGIDLWIRRLLNALFLTHRNSATFYSVKEHGNSRCSWVCIHQAKIYLLYIRNTKGAIYIQAWASALLVLADWAMQEPLCVGRVTVRLPRFFRKYTYQPYENNRRIRESSC